MSIIAADLSDLEIKAGVGEPFSRADAERVFAAPDLISVGMLGEAMRKALHGSAVTYGRVFLAGAATQSPTPAEGDAGEIRIEAAAASVEDLQRLVRSAAALARGMPLTGFSMEQLLGLAGADHVALADLAREISGAGLEAVASVPIDRLGDLENTIEVVRAVRHGGLGVWRLTVDRGAVSERLDLMERAAALQRELGGFHAFAPLPRLDPAETPATGYDDVRTIAAARLVCRDIPHIQVDWQLYGPKLAQVAIAYGADDIDNVSAVDTLQLGHRRSPREDIERQITAACAAPAERDGRFVLRP